MNKIIIFQSGSHVDLSSQVNLWLAENLNTTKIFSMDYGYYSGVNTLLIFYKNL